MLYDKSTKEAVIIIYHHNDDQTQGDHIKGLYHTKRTMQHELGHIMAIHKYGRLKPDEKWLKAIAADNTSVSRYGDTTTAEDDFAEAMQLYMMTNGGLYHPEVVRKYAHRFAILDEIMELSPFQRNQINSLNHFANDLLGRFGLPTDEFIGEHLIIEFMEDLSFLLNDDFNLMTTLIEKLRSSKQQNPNIKFTKSLDSLLEDGFSSELMLTGNLRNFWRRNPYGIKTLKVLADKLHNPKRNKSLGTNSLGTNSLGTNSIENHLTRQILGALLIIGTNNIPEFITETIHLFDTLSVFEMEHRSHILKQAFNLIESNNSITFEQALKEAKLLIRQPTPYHTEDQITL